MLQDDHFTSKFEAGDAHWSELKQRWIGGSPILQAILAPGPADPTHSTKQRAIEVLGRDVLKRLRDDQTRRGLGRRKSSSLSTSGLAIGNVQTTATNQATPEDNSVNDANTVVGQDSGQARIRNGISTLASQALASESIMTDLQIDPSLLQAAAREPAFAFAQQGQQPVPEQVQQNPLEAVASGEGPAQPLEGEENLGLAPHPPSMPVYPHTYVHDAAGMVHPSQPPDVSQQAASGAQEDAPSSIR
ncbi:hypothetical protein KEM55_001819 [Ascosphaera atra]|nr:hypothetical protein KEM55_001819 [Ascosphaera atra]